MYGDPRPGTEHPGMIRVVRGGTLDDTSWLKPTAHFWIGFRRKASRPKVRLMSHKLPPVLTDQQPAITVRTAIDPVNAAVRCAISRPVCLPAVVQTVQRFRRQGQNRPVPWFLKFHHAR
jgi:hypothetical protein